MFHIFLILLNILSIFIKVLLLIQYIPRDLRFYLFELQNLDHRKSFYLYNNVKDY